MPTDRPISHVGINGEKRTRHFCSDVGFSFGGTDRHSQNSVTQISQLRFKTNMYTYLYTCIYLNTFHVSLKLEEIIVHNIMNSDNAELFWFRLYIKMQ